MIEPNYFNELAQNVHDNENKKWWYNKDGSVINNPDRRLLMLVVSELVEAMEGDRKDLNDDKLTHRKMIEVELADTVLRMLDRMIGKKLKPFRGVYRPKKIDDQSDITEILYDITSLLFNPITKDETEIVVYKVLDFGHTYGYDILSAIREKREYNQSRIDHSYSSRESANGKKY